MTRSCRSRIYLASSWRNPDQPVVLQALRAGGHEVYDFRSPEPGSTGFAWSDIDPGWESWDAEQFREGIAHPIAQDGYETDRRAMDWAEVCVLALPCGRSAHLEAGYMAGQGKEVYVLLDGGEPELMYLLLGRQRLMLDLGELLDALGGGVPAEPEEN